MADKIWVPICLFMFVFPNLFCWAAIKLAEKRKNYRTITISHWRDDKGHLLTYLFAMLIPLFDANLGDMRDVAALLLAFAIVVFLFLYLRLHYINLVFAALGYEILTVDVTDSLRCGSGTKEVRANFVVLTRQRWGVSPKSVTGLRLGRGVLLERGD